MILALNMMFVSEVPWECDDSGSDYGCYVIRGPDFGGMEALTFDDAKADCERIGGQLAVAKTAQQVEDLATYMGKLILMYCKT